MQDRDPRSGHTQDRHRKWLAALAAVVVFYACALPIVFSGAVNRGRAAADHLNYHEPVIHAFADGWPTPDLSNYHSATTPLYHLILAGAEIAFEPSRRGFMVLGSLFTAGLLVLLTVSLPVRPGRAVVLVLPVLGSMYVFFPGVWLLPDNAGWLGVLAILVLALRREMNWRVLAASGAVLLALVLVRQIHLWAAGLVWAAAWLGPDSGEDLPAIDEPIDVVGQVRALLDGLGGRVRRLVPAVLVTVPAFLAVGYFYQLWGGVVVPRYQAGDHGGYHGWNPATPAFHLAVVGSFVPFFVGYMVPGLRRLVRNPGVLIGVIALVVVLVAVPATSYAPELGRKSGLWNLVPKVPLIAGRTSPVLLVLAPVGAIGIAALLAQVRARRGWIYLGAFVAFNAAQTMSPQLWQRYHEPFILMVLALLASEGSRLAVPGWARAWRWAGPMVLGVGLGALTALTVATDKPAVPLKTGDFERSTAYEPLD